MVLRYEYILFILFFHYFSLLSSMCTSHDGKWESTVLGKLADSSSLYTVHNNKKHQTVVSSTTVTTANVLIIGLLVSW